MIKAGFLVDRLSHVVGGVGVIGAAALFACIAGTNPATAASGKTVASDWTKVAPPPGFGVPVEVAQAKGDDLLLQKKGDDSLLQTKGDDLLLENKKGGDSLLEGPAPKAATPAPSSTEKKQAAKPKTAAEEHAKLFAENRFPSATTCGTCHPRQFKQWAVSQHSYSQLSPLFLTLQNFISTQVNGTQGDFCSRCHTQVGMNIGETPGQSILTRHPASREGITCVICHRVELPYNKASGRIDIVEGDLLQPVYGPKGDAELKRVLSEPQKYRVVTKENEPGRKIHTKVVKFAQLSSSTFCAMCHDVTLLNGFRLEEAFSEYRDSPAAAKGITCQDCHMGKIQGIPSGYDYGPAAVVGGVPTKPRKLTNHLMSGPDYSVVHPGIFPHNAEAQQLATMAEWLKFDYKAGWGTDKFENTVTPDMKFPSPWDSIDARYDAREILNYQFKRLAFARTKRLEVLRNGYGLGNIEVTKASNGGIDFRAKVMNKTEGHNTPTGFTGERLVWLWVTVTDSTGKVVFQSGNTDPNGDVLDNESSYVHTGRMPLDKQLFTLQSRFLVSNIRGGARERTVTIPYSTTSLPFLRPTRRSLILTGESIVERNHRKGIEPLGHRWADYHVSADKLAGSKGPYKIDAKLLGQMIPVNLITTIQSVGIDQGISPRAAADAVVAGREVIWEKTATVSTGGEKMSQLEN